ncbi:RTA1 like protein-domain-containing protein [Xylariaceae sp. FL0016]|nr:RTA1 like protein-domain-containing protein [Xylariaceae sp. FL0016]
MANSADCNSGDCARVFLTYQPSLAGNAVLLALFAILIVVALTFGFKYRSSVFATAVSTGLGLEVMGYIGRLLLHGNPDSRGDFIVFLLGTILGPTCICGAMFLVMPRIVKIYGDEYHSWRPVWYLFLFYALTTVSLILQLAGILVSTVLDGSDMIDIGVRVTVVGLVIQLVAIAIFVGHAILFAIALRTRRHVLDDKYASVYSSGFYKGFMVAFSTATVLLLVRTAYRTVDIAEGYESSIAQSEALFLVLDGVMVLLSTILLLAFFPARALGASWTQTSTRSTPLAPPRPERTSHSQVSSPHHSPHPSPAYQPKYQRMSIKSTASRTPVKQQYPPPPQRNMVDSDALW